MRRIAVFSLLTPSFPPFFEGVFDDFSVTKELLKYDHYYQLDILVSW